MDARCVGGFDAPHEILYGHNAHDGSMFGSLDRLLALEAGKYPAITLALPNGIARTYRIFAVRESDMGDTAYRLGLADAEELDALAAKPGAPTGTTHILTLSTCTDAGSRDKRLLVHAAQLLENQ